MGWGQTMYVYYTKFDRKTLEDSIRRGTHFIHIFMSIRALVHNLAVAGDDHGGKEER